MRKRLQAGHDALAEPAQEVSLATSRTHHRLAILRQAAFVLIREDDDTYRLRPDLRPGPARCSSTPSLPEAAGKIQGCTSPSDSSPACASAPGPARLELDGVARVADVWSGSGSATSPAACSTRSTASYVEPTHELHDGDEVAVIPPVSGGAS